MLEAARCVADVQAKLIRLDAVLKVKSQGSDASDQVQSFLITRQNESTQALNDADNELTRANMAVAVVASDGVCDAFNTMIGTLRNVSQKVLTDGAVDQYSANREDIQKALNVLVRAIRAELLMTSTHQSSESSALGS